MGQVTGWGCVGAGLRLQLARLARAARSSRSLLDSGVEASFSRRAIIILSTSCTTFSNWEPDRLLLVHVIGEKVGLARAKARARES